MSDKVDITLTINGRAHAISVEPRKTLVDAIRDDCGQTGTHIGCEHGICGTCTIILDGEAIRSCLMFAIQADGRQIRTVEGLANGEKLHPLQQAFIDHHGLQCGFCTPGFLMLATNALERNPNIGDDELLDVLVVQPLPLHRVPEHHQIGACRPRHDARREGAMSHGGDGHDYPTPPTSRRRGACLAHAVTRIEDRPLVTGRGRYAGDINFPHQLHMRVVRSPKAHGKIVSVDASAALKMPGVVAVWTNDDIADLSPIDFRADKNATGIREFRQPALAKTYVRYVGDPVAAVFADDPYVAEDAAEQVAIEIEELPVVVSASDPPGEFEPGRSSEAIVLHHSFGDIEAAFQKGPRGGRDRCPDRPPLRRADGNARRHRRL